MSKPADGLELQQYDKVHESNIRHEEQNMAMEGTEVETQTIDTMVNEL